MEEKPVKVRLGKTDYLIPLLRIERPIAREYPNKLIRITSHPLNPKKLLVWRQLETEGLKGATDRHLSVYEAEKGAGVLKEQEEPIANLVYAVFAKDKEARAWNFFVAPKFKRKTIGTALRETMLRDLKGLGIESISFPPHKESGFYLPRGFERSASGIFHGKVEKLGVKPAGIKLKILWQRSRPRFAR